MKDYSPDKNLLKRPARNVRPHRIYVGEPLVYDKPAASCTPILFYEMAAPPID
jgi:hypothetical protein